MKFKVLVENSYDNRLSLKNDKIKCKNLIIYLYAHNIFYNKCVIFLSLNCDFNKYSKK